MCGLGTAASAAEPTMTKSRMKMSDEKPPLKSGLKTGDEIRSFYTRAVTGPLMNKSVCYVCRNGTRPVVMIVMRTMHADLNLLMKNIDRLVDRSRAQGLRGFGVLLSEDSIKATSAVQTFAFDHKIGMPLTIAGETVAAAGFQNLPAEAAVTVVLYHKLKVVQSWSYRSGDLKSADVKAIVKRIDEFAVKK